MESIKKYNINWSPNFQRELGNIYSYINNVLQEHTTAVKLYDSIITEIYSLNYSPEKFVIIYEVDKQKRRSFYFTYLSL